MNDTRWVACCCVYEELVSRLVPNFSQRWGDQKPSLAGAAKAPFYPLTSSRLRLANSCVPCCLLPRLYSRQTYP
jgi:hypothetical protein